MPESKVIFDIRFIADTPRLREKGLMFSEPLEDKEVVFFVFPHVDNYAFWNKNVSFPLSLAFINENGKIVDIGELKSNSEKQLTPNSNEVKYVIEAKHGIFNILDIKKGDFVNYNDGRLEITK